MRHVVSRAADGQEVFSKTRKVSVAYYLEYLGFRHRVCQSFFLKTLHLSNTAVQTAIDGKTDSGTFGKLDGRGRQPSVNKTDAEHMDAVRKHIKSFPTVESHYCRKDSQRQYLDSKLTIKRMYDLYVEKCQNEFDENYQPVSVSVYRHVFNEEFNMGFYKPKKDQCAECSKFELMTPADKETCSLQLEEHLARNKEAQIAKANDKQRAHDDAAFRSVTFDLQSVLQVPSSDASLMYYKRKLCCYNFTVYEQAEPNDGHCYLWSEVDGRRGSNEIGSCLLQYLQTQCKKYPCSRTLVVDKTGIKTSQQCFCMQFSQLTTLVLLSKSFWKRGTLIWSATPCILLLSLLKGIVLCFVCQHGKLFLKLQGAEILTKFIS